MGERRNGTIPHLSIGDYVRCLVEYEPVGTRLMAVDW